MAPQPKILRVESGLILHRANVDPAAGVALPYRRPSAWERFEHRIGLPLHLAMNARRAAEQCDVVWAGNEQIGFALGLMGVRKPLVVIAHHIESPRKARLARISRAVRRWAGIGYITEDGRRFLTDYFGIPASRLFQYESAKYLHRAAIPPLPSTGAIISIGVSKRDYRTLINALQDLPGYETDVFPSSKFEDLLQQEAKTSIPSWVRLHGWIDEAELMQRYRRARFAIIPLVETTQSTAGTNAVLEAAAFGKTVIATRTGGMTTMIKDGETGLLVPPGDPGALRRAIRTLWEQPDQAHRMGLAARRHAEAHFDPTVVDGNIIAFLNHLVEGAPPA